MVPFLHEKVITVTPRHFAANNPLTTFPKPTFPIHWHQNSHRALVTISRVYIARRQKL